MKTIIGIAPPENVAIRQLDKPILLSSEGIELLQAQYEWLHSQLRQAFQEEAEELE